MCISIKKNKIKNIERRWLTSMWTLTDSQSTTKRQCLRLQNFDEIITSACFDLPTLYTPIGNGIGVLSMPPIRSKKNFFSIPEDCVFELSILNVLERISSIWIRYAFCFTASDALTTVLCFEYGRCRMSWTTVLLFWYSTRFYRDGKTQTPAHSSIDWMTFLT